MPFRNKLSRRFALRRFRIVGPVLLVTACDLIDLTPLAFTQLIISPKDVELEPFETVQFEARGITLAGDTVPTSVDWSATGGEISAEGVFTAAEEGGPYLVSATSQIGKLKDSTKVTVRAPLQEIILTPDSVDLTSGTTAQFVAYGRRKGDSVDVAVSFTATGGSITGDGMYTAGDSLGRTLVVATEQRPDYHKNNRKPKVDSAVVHIRLVTSSCVSISLTPTAATLRVGGTEQFTAQTLDAGGSVIQDAEMSWRSNSPEVASVSSDGLVSATALGTAVIVAGSMGCSESATVRVIDESVDDGLVADLMPAHYDTARVTVGDAYYVDRAYTITGLDPAHEGWLWIRTANDDKTLTADTVITFRLLDSATVAVAYDSRATILPSWLQGWTQAPTTIGVSDDAVRLRVLSKTHGPGPVGLGGNLAGGTADAASNYVVLVNPAEDPTETGNLSVTTTTTGTNLDPDGYTVTVDGTQSQAIGVNGTLNLTSLAIGDHTVKLGDVALNCTVAADNPRTVSVTFNGTATTSFAVTCTALTGDLQVSNTTTGTDPDTDYTVTIDAGTPQAMPADGTLTLTGLAVGDHTVALGDVAQNCTVAGNNPRTVSVTFNGTATTSFAVTCTASGLPYPRSDVIESIRWDFGNLVRLAPGSDLWPVTWGPDGHLHTSWGDGGGFGGTNSDGRVSLGFGRIEGTPSSFTGFNVWGGKNPENPATFGGKAISMISVGGVLYAWLNTQSGADPDFRLAYSTDLAASWTEASWDFVGSTFGEIGFINFGQDNAGARDTFVYMYGVKRVSGRTTIELARVPEDQILTRNSYEFFTGLSGTTPQWSSDIADRVAVFEDTNGVGIPSASYNPGISRYLLTTAHGDVWTGLKRLGVFDAPEPWGPWTTAFYSDDWGVGYTGFRLTYNIPTKQPSWMSPDGTVLHLMFSGEGTFDSFNLLRATVTLRTP